MRRVVLLAALALAACGEDSEEPKNENPPAGWVFCNDKDLGIINDNDEAAAITVGKECNAIRGTLDFSGRVNSLESLKQLRHIQGSLVLTNTDITDLSPMYSLETVKAVSIQGNDELDNCAATALAYTLTGDLSRVKDNKGEQTCLELPR